MPLHVGKLLQVVAWMLASVDVALGRRGHDVVIKETCVRCEGVMHACSEVACVLAGVEFCV